MDVPAFSETQHTTPTRPTDGNTTWPSELPKDPKLYAVENFEPEPPEELLCGICHDVLCEAAECPCRHVFCRRCIASQRSCPLCKARLTQLMPVLPIVNKIISKLSTKCPHRAFGCTSKDADYGYRCTFDEYTPEQPLSWARERPIERRQPPEEARFNTSFSAVPTSDTRCQLTPP
ncbi:hypothetical protein HPB50_028554 [Hyalomma asiaticum]|nr:hypothetical protein HPB50_028554 [Hyalomma asiaticum]